MRYLEHIKPNAVFAIALALNVMLQPSYPAVLMFVGFLAFVAYSAKIDAENASAVRFNYFSRLAERLDKADATIEAINGDLSSVIKSHAEIQKMAEETKKLLTESKLTTAFGQRTKRL